MNDLGFIEKEIKVEGLKKEYRILHVTDFHIVMCDERDADFVNTRRLLLERNEDLIPYQIP